MKEKKSLSDEFFLGMGYTLNLILMYRVIIVMPCLGYPFLLISLISVLHTRNFQQILPNFYVHIHTCENIHVSISNVQDIFSNVGQTQLIKHCMLGNRTFVQENKIV